MADSVRDLQSTLASLPPVVAKDLRGKTQTAIRSGSLKVPLLVVLDDDPTGTQTCHDIIILTAWDTQRLIEEFRATPVGSGFFILTNSRALHPPQARALITEICQNLQAASMETGIDFEVVLRSDSTLRGHFPLEAEAAEAVLGKADAIILCPFFLQGGRYTIDDVHYVQEGDRLLPAAQTPFAKDATFGGKGQGSIQMEDVTSISLETIRVGGTDAVLKQLLETTSDTSRKPVIVLNAAAEEDMDVAMEALLKASSSGKRFLFRTGAAFVSARLAIEGIPPISAATQGLSSKVGGLVIAGSYVPKTTAQLESLRTRSGDKLTSVVLEVRNLLESPENATKAVSDALKIAEAEIAKGQDAKSLDIGSVVAKTLVSFLERLEQKPRYVIAKGGITSSDMATKGLRFKRAAIVGQAAPGVPLWRCDEPSAKWPGLPYVVFPGNVGTNDTLFEVVNGWRV
uniref:Ketose-bisphosphate aldolase class-II family protein n=1 Tax=Bionectria ochroleuca TaxID=29856 RepID=A0A8H7NQH4_BIOOC